MEDGYDRQKELADRALRKESDADAKPDELTNSPIGESDSEIVILSLVGAFIVGALMGLFACGGIWLIADFSEHYDNFSMIIASVAGPIIGGIFGVIVELIRQKRI